MREFLWVRPMVDIGERLKYIRETYDVSQEEMGRVLGVSKTSVSHYENNDYIIPMRKLCAFLIILIYRLIIFLILRI